MVGIKLTVRKERKCYGQRGFAQEQDIDAKRSILGCFCIFSRYKMNVLGNPTEIKYY
ncbi:hypothetical protein ACFLQN_02895 [Candidatus Aenigmatarchaeota archaeon]